MSALFQVLLVVFFGAPERLRGLDPGYDPAGLEAALAGQLLHLRLGLRLLLRGMEEDGGTVLRAPVRALPVQRGGIVKRKERVQKLLKTHLFGVEVQLDDLCVPRLVRANVLVRRTVECAAFIAHGGGRYARNGRKLSLNAPKTPCSECRFFDTHAQ